MTIDDSRKPLVNGATSDQWQSDVPPPVAPQGMPVVYGQPVMGQGASVPQYGAPIYQNGQHMYQTGAPVYQGQSVQGSYGSAYNMGPVMVPPPAPLVATNTIITGPNHTVVSMDNIVPLTEKYDISMTGQCVPTNATPPYYRRTVLILACFMAAASGFSGYYGGELTLILGNTAASILLIVACVALGILALGALAMLFLRRDEKKIYPPLQSPGTLELYLEALRTFGVSQEQLSAVHQLMLQAHPHIRHHVVVWFSKNRRGQQFTAYFGRIAEMGTTKTQSHFYRLE